MGNRLTKRVLSVDFVELRVAKFVFYLSLCHLNQSNKYEENITNLVHRHNGYDRILCMFFWR